MSHSTIHNGFCVVCGRDYSAETPAPTTCPSDDCPSHDLKKMKDAIEVLANLPNIRTVLHAVGWCPDCETTIEHEIDEPFSFCQCGQGEDCSGPGLIQRLVMRLRDLRLDEPPVRLCCGQRHAGPVCPDGKVMCCLCYGRFAVADLNVSNGKPEDVCKACAEEERERIRNLPERP